MLITMIVYEAHYVSIDRVGLGLETPALVMCRN